MELKVIPQSFSVCQVADYSQVDWSAPFCFPGKTDEENSLVCPSDAVPANVLKWDDGWRAFRIEGVLDFSLIGILSAISSLLAAQKIGIFALSTYNTDYVLTKAAQFPQALATLREAGYTILL